MAAESTRAMEPRRGRTIHGHSAILLPFTEEGGIDWAGYGAHLERTLVAGLVPAVNMDTGFGPHLSPAERTEALRIATAATVGAPGQDRFVAGALVDDTPGAPPDEEGYLRSIEEVVAAGGTPILFPSHGLAEVPEPELVALHERLGARVDRFLGFELGRMFHPAGRIWSIEAFEAMLAIPSLVGAKHSSLRRGPELERIEVRDRVRPGFMVLTGNDLAIDMVAYGSDYLLGLSTFAPDAFAARDAAWAAGDDVGFWELNDVLQYLGQLAFRDPVPGYRHDAAMFLHLRGWIDCDRTHPDSPARPEWDRETLRQVAERLPGTLEGVTG